MRITFPEVWELDMLVTAKVAFKNIDYAENVSKQTSICIVHRRKPL